MKRYILLVGLALLALSLVLVACSTKTAAPAEPTKAAPVTEPTKSDRSHVVL